MKIKKGETYGEFVKRLRQTANLTQEELALRLGISRKSVGNWENGTEPSFICRRLIDEFAKGVKG